MLCKNRQGQEGSKGLTLTIVSDYPNTLATQYGIKSIETRLKIKTKQNRLISIT